jgi:hypothetical protein
MGAERGSQADSTSQVGRGAGKHMRNASKYIVCVSVESTSGHKEGEVHLLGGLGGGSVCFPLYSAIFFLARCDEKVMFLQF